MKTFVSLVLGLSVLGFGSGLAQAGCSLGDLRGVWLVEGVGGGVAGHCRLIFGPSGTLQSGSNCQYDEPETLTSYTVNAKGTLSLVNGPECAYIGNLSITGNDASTARVKLRMSGSKDEIIAAGPVTTTLVATPYNRDAVVQFSAFRRPR